MLTSDGPAGVGVVNLSRTYNLSPPQVSLLSRGLSFAPTYQQKTHRPSTQDIELSRYHRSLKLAYVFQDEQDEAPDPTPGFVEKSVWEPKPARLPLELWELIAKDREVLAQIPPVQETDKNNITADEWEALESLQKESSLIIKPADKGSSVVIMDRPLYVMEAERQLNNTDHYQLLEAPIYPESTQLFNTILQDMQKEGFLKQQQVEYLSCGENPRPRHLYLLPKIHKKESSWPVQGHMPPGRPIISDCSSESYRIAEFLEFHLNPISTRHPSYLRDTQDFLNKLADIQLDDDDIFFTMDVEALYTEIETHLGLAAVRKYLRRYPRDDRSDEHILQLLELSLTRNDFTFNGKWYLQVRGTAMGKRFAPSYANIYMAEWEESAFRKCTKLPKRYFRYLDDIWGVWPYTLEELHVWVKTLNDHHPSINLTLTASRSTVDFLDITIFKGPNFSTTHKLDTKVYFKPTDTQALLHFESFHPKHTFSGIIKSQLTRYHRICSREEDWNHATKKLFRALRGRGYTRNFLNQTLKKWSEDQRQKNHSTETETPGRIVPIVSVYSTFAQKVNQLLKKNLDEMSPQLTFTQDLKVVSAYRRNPNLKDLLVRSKLSKGKHQKKKRPYTSFLRNPTTKQTFHLPKSIPYSTRNCVYAIKCKLCGKIYVGETSNTLASRLHSHTYAIRTGTNRTHLGKHFRRHGLQHLLFKPLQHQATWTTKERQKTERIWIQRLSSLHPTGLNTRFTSARRH